MQFGDLGHKRGAHPKQGPRKALKPWLVFEELDHALFKGEACGAADFEPERLQGATDFIVDGDKLLDQGFAMREEQP